MLVELGQMAARRARAGPQVLEVVAEARWQAVSTGARDGTVAAAREARWQTCGCAGRRSAWQGSGWTYALRLVLEH